MLRQLTRVSISSFLHVEMANSFQTEPEISRASYFDGTRRSPRKLDVLCDVIKSTFYKMSRPQKDVFTKSAVLNELPRVSLSCFLPVERLKCVRMSSFLPVKTVNTCQSVQLFTC